MSNSGTLAVKIVALAGGAVIGAVLARLFDEWLARQDRQQSDYDRTRYEQGLAPLSPEPPTKEEQQ